MKYIVLNVYRGTVHAVDNLPADRKTFMVYGSCSAEQSAECLMAIAANKSRSLGFGGERLSMPSSFVEI